MPKLERYQALVKVTVELRTAEQGQVASYSVVRKADGPSMTLNAPGPARNMNTVVEAAMVDALAAERALRAGMQNAESRRLK